MVRLVGWRGIGLTSHEEQRVQQIIDRSIERLNVFVEDIIDVSLRVRKVNKGGHANRYEISLSLITPGGLVNSRSEDWNIIDSVHKAFANVETQLEHKERVRERLYAHTRATSVEPLLRM